MLELIKSVIFAVVMVPVVMAIIFALIYLVGELFNFISMIGHKKEEKQS